MDSNNEQEQRDAIAKSYAEQVTRAEPDYSSIALQGNLPQFMSDNFDQIAAGLRQRIQQLQQDIASRQAELRIAAADLFMIDQCKAATRLDSALFTREPQTVSKEEKSNDIRPKTGFSGRRPGIDPRRSGLIGSDNQQQSPQNQPPQ